MYSFAQITLAFSLLSHFWLPIQSKFWCPNAGTLTCCTITPDPVDEQVIRVACGLRAGWNIEEKGCSGKGYPRAGLDIKDIMACCTRYLVCEALSVNLRVYWIKLSVILTHRAMNSLMRTSTRSVGKLQNTSTSYRQRENYEKDFVWEPAATTPKMKT